jgi:multidrug efflux pump subunit AcrA (membrane-fusion protein)
MKVTNTAILGMALLIAFAGWGCQGESQTDAAATTAPIATQTFPQLLRKNGQEYLALKTEDVPGISYLDVQELALPGVLETTGQVTFDDRLVSTITSRVVGRIENIRVSLWDKVRKGQPIVELYSPDFMLGESEYLEAQDTSAVSLHTSVEGSADLAKSMVQAAKRKLELLGMSNADIDAIRSPAPNTWMRSAASAISRGPRASMSRSSSSDGRSI